MNKNWIEKEVSISEIDRLLKEDYEIEVSSPDGFVPVNFFVDKGMWDEFILKDEFGEILVRCNQDHLFETAIGWTTAMQMYKAEDYVNVLFEDGKYHRCVVDRTGDRIPIVDINVDHENHRYYTNGVSSHNTGVGKTLAMCHMAAANIRDGKNVLYITLEMAEERISERIDANLLNVPLDQIKDMSKKMFSSRVNDIQSKANGKLVVKEYPTAAAHSGNFRYLMNELVLKKNFTPDIVYIDYLNICGSMRMKMTGSINSYTYIKAIAEELRGLAVEKDLPIVTATQLNRSGYVNSDPGLEDTSESFGLPATADFMMALISNDEMAEMNQIMVKQLKNRYNDPATYRKFMVGVDRPKMRLFDVEQEVEEEEDDIPVFDNTTIGKSVKRDFSKLIS